MNAALRRRNFRFFFLIFLGFCLVDITGCAQRRDIEFNKEEQAKTKDSIRRAVYIEIYNVNQKHFSKKFNSYSFGEESCEQILNSLYSEHQMVFELAYSNFDLDTMQ